MQPSNRFVVLQHAHRGVHWDFMLQHGDALRTWALEGPPDAPRPIAAKPLADHRLAYLDYEGPLSGDRGSVSRWDAGTYELVEETPEAVQVRLLGQRLEGAFELVLEGAHGGWTFRRLDV